MILRRLMSSSSKGTEEVLFNVANEKIGLVTLNRPKALNSLNINMVRLMYDQLNSWKTNRDIRAVVVEGEGKAFCAGGDVVTITRDKGSQYQKDFFKEEYRLDRLTSLMPNYVALADGIVMGGGVGISVHGKYRVATEKTLFAMPETGIGLVPDVGGSYFLPRIPLKGLGMFLALSGHRLKGASDCLAAGIATHACDSDKLADLKSDLLKSDGDVEAILDAYSAKYSNSKTFSLEERMSDISRIFDGKSAVEDIIEDLRTSGGDWGQKTAVNMLKMSPTSMKVTFRMIEEGAKCKDLAECLKMEYRLVRRCCEDEDFYEGIRAVLVDKDNSPKWKPDALQNVSKADVDRYFSPLDDPKEELNF